MSPAVSATLAISREDQSLTALKSVGLSAKQRPQKNETRDNLT